MATSVEEDVEYDSDPEEAKRSLTMRRRREASDDEEGEGGGSDKRDDLHVTIHSDDSDGEGGVAEYYDDDEEEELEEEEVVDDEEEEVDERVEEKLYEERGLEEEAAAGGVEGSVVVDKESDGDNIKHQLEDSNEMHSEEKKENEPFAVPTAGAFYMHDDRFSDNAGARNRFVHTIQCSVTWSWKNILVF